MLTFAMQGNNSSHYDTCKNNKQKRQTELQRGPGGDTSGETLLLAYLGYMETTNRTTTPNTGLTLEREGDPDPNPNPGLTATRR